MFNYIFEGKTYTDTSNEYMLAIGMSAEQIESVMSQKAYEEGEGAIAKRKAAYTKESDPLFLEWQYDKTPATEAKWRAKVLEIKARFPMVSADA
ncbi:hypothetical protein [Shewanella sp. W3-18-1]|uniref:hypothetical protein n=1 Tax=Shewanella sp. (strain W3-18-1) TaxID=351745 RepID=UPI00059BF9BB|nr:hypothetical protein [Shewanella sp. W3-18-1]